jgi:hypothetical protein
MKKGMKGIVAQVRPEILAQRLKVTATVRVESGEAVVAQMPDREVSAILPRSVLVGTARTAPVSLLGTLQPILSRMTEGRQVRIWQYRERWFFSFVAWRGVRFLSDQEAEEAQGTRGTRETPAAETPAAQPPAGLAAGPVISPPG